MVCNDDYDGEDGNEGDSVRRRVSVKESEDGSGRHEIVRVR